MSKQVYNDKTLGRVYAFKFIYHLFLKEFEADKAAVIEDEKKLLELISEFEESYMTQDDEHLNNTLNPEIQSFGKTLIKGFLKEQDDIIEKLKPLIQKRSYASVEPMERSLLELAAFEILILSTPRKVVINEYLNINKEYGQSETTSFINGVLDKLA
ncbi:MAG: transcription antitermination factor NusB [Bdellovibrionota bacterium]|nr:transcription antitermination factor NusB [Bdellovibrionota bacterium]